MRMEIGESNLCRSTPAIAFVGKATAQTGRAGVGIFVETGAAMKRSDMTAKQTMANPPSCTIPIVSPNSSHAMTAVVGGTR